MTSSDLPSCLTVVSPCPQPLLGWGSAVWFKLNCLLQCPLGPDRELTKWWLCRVPRTAPAPLHLSLFSPFPRSHGEDQQVCIQSEDEIPIFIAIKSPPNYEDSVTTALGFRMAGKYFRHLLTWAGRRRGGGRGSGGCRDSWPHSLSPRGGVWLQFHTHESALLEHGDWGQGGHRLHFTLSHKFWGSKVSPVHSVCQQTSAEHPVHLALAWRKGLGNSPSQPTILHVFLKCFHPYIPGV